jgi:hypothetical protein
MTDRTTVGLYFADRPANREVRTLTLRVDGLGDKLQAGEHVVAGQVISQDIEAVALRAESPLSNMAVRVDAILPNGTRDVLIRLHPRPDWQRRYWFTSPIPLPRGSRIEVVAAASDLAGQALAGSAAAPRQDDGRAGHGMKPALSLTIDFVNRPARRAAN